MTTTPKTIQIFLPGGDPRGIRVAEITTRIVQVIEVPRSLLQDFLKMPEAEQVAVYFLVGEAGPEGNEPGLYVGQTSDLVARFKKHNKEKDFWQRALVLVSKTHSLTQTHALYLEWYCIQEAKKAARYADENGNGGSRPHTTRPLEADCLEIFETGRTLLATLGHPLFDPVAPPASSQSQELFFCDVAGSKGRGVYTPEGFVVLKGAIGKRANLPSLKPSGVEFRQRLFDAGVIKEQGENILFERDYLFTSPSAAAIALLGRPSNGWREWHDAQGRTLDDVKRSGPQS